MIPSPLPLRKNPDPAWEALRIYLLAFLYLLPSIFVANFALAYVFPRAKQIWGEAGLNASKANWLMDSVEEMIPYFVFLGSGFIVFVVICSVAWSNWRRYR